MEREQQGPRYPPTRTNNLLFPVAAPVNVFYHHNKTVTVSLRTAQLGIWLAVEIWGHVKRVLR